MFSIASIGSLEHKTRLYCLRCAFISIFTSIHIHIHSSPSVVINMWQAGKSTNYMVNFISGKMTSHGAFFPEEFGVNHPMIQRDSALYTSDSWINIDVEKSRQNPKWHTESWWPLNDDVRMSNDGNWITRYGINGITIDNPGHDLSQVAHFSGEFWWFIQIKRLTNC